MCQLPGKSVGIVTNECDEGEERGIFNIFICSVFEICD